MSGAGSNLVHKISRDHQADPKLPLRKRHLRQLAARAGIPIPRLPREIARDAAGRIIAIKWGTTWHAQTCACAECVPFIAEKIGVSAGSFFQRIKKLGRGTS